MYETADSFKKNLLFTLVLVTALLMIVLTLKILEI